MSTTTSFIFRTQVDQGSGDWTAGEMGIGTTCFPWTDNIQLEQIKSMWRRAVPHELGHHFIANLPKPYWAEEGIAEYIAHKITNQTLDCSPAHLIPIEGLQGENMPQYESAACVWKLLEKQYPGILVRALDIIDTMKKSQDKYRPSDTDFFVKEVLRQAAGNKSSDLLVDFFTTKFHFTSQSFLSPSN